MRIKHSIFHVLVAAAGLGYMSLAFSQIEMVVEPEADPDPVQVQVKEIRYLPGERTLVVRSIHEDIRCAVDQGPSDGDFKVVLDQVNPATEPEAVYRVLDSGSVQLKLNDGVFELVTGDGLDCTPFRDSFWASDFGDLIALASAAPELIEAGATDTITLTVTNSSKSVVATNVQVFLDSGFEPFDTSLITGPVYNPSSGTVDSNNHTWTIPSLWPLQSVTLEATYTVDSSLLDTARIILEIENVTADDRAGNQPLGTGNPSLVTVVNTGT